MSATTTLRMILLGEDKSAGKTIKGVGSEADKSSSKMAKFHQVGSAAGKALSVGLLGAGAAAIAMTKRAAEDEQAASKLAQTLHKAAGATDSQVASTEKWITAQGKAFGVTDDDLRPALSRLAVATGSVSKAQKLASLAMDVSAGTGKSLESVSTALAKAQNGNVSGLSRLGVATKNAKGETLTLTQVTKQLSDHFKGAAAASADTAAGKQKILTVQMGELQEQIGAKLLPVMLKLVNVGLSVVNWVSRNTTTVGVLLGVLGTLLAITWAVSTATKVWFALTKLQTAASIVMTNAQWAMNVAMEANPIGLVVLAVVALVAALVIAYKKSETFRNIVNGAFHAVANAAQAVFGWIKSHWKLLASILGGPFVAAAILIISNWGKIKAATSAAVNAVKRVVSAGWNAVKGATSTAWNAVKNVISGVWNGIRSLVKTQISLLVGMVRGIPGTLRNLGHLFLDAGKFLIQSLFRGIVTVAKAGTGFVTDFVNGIRNAINSTLHLPLSVNFDKGPIHIHATVIPALAKGGIVNSPTLALIGEAGPEAVVPLSRAGGFGGGPMEARIELDITQDGRVIQKKLLTLKRQQGGVALGIS